MARVQVKNAIVLRAIRDMGFACAERYTTRNGEQKQTNYTVWVDNASDIPPNDSTVNVEGNVSARAEEFQNQSGETIRYGAIHINQPIITMVESPNQIVESMPTEVPF